MFRDDFVRMPEEEKAKRLSITLKPDVIKELDNFAEQWGVSRSGMISILVKLKKLDAENYWANIAEEDEISEDVRKDFGIKKKHRI